jgi:hypothetical protein
MITLLRLIPKSATDKDIEILTLRHQLAVLQRQTDKPRFCQRPCECPHWWPSNVPTCGRVRS